MNPEAKIARAALVVENVSNLVVDNFTVDWPESDEVPADWAFPKRIANGTLDAIYHDYSSSRQTEFNAIWGRGLDGGYIHTPGLKSSSNTMKTFDIKNSNIKFEK